MTLNLNRYGNKRGATLLTVAIALVALFAVAALAIDLGMQSFAGQQCQDAADAAAMAGCAQLRLGMDPAAAKTAAIEGAAGNKVAGTAVTVTTADVTVGAWNSTTKTVTTWDPTATQVAVKVVVRRTASSPDGPIPTYFARVIGKNSVEVTRTAIAGLVVDAHVRAPLGFMIVQDGSSSFSSAWNSAVDADVGLFNLINGVSVSGDAAGIVTYNCALSESYLRSAGLWDYYRSYPSYNTGIKYTTDSGGRPRKTTDEGVTSSSGSVRAMVGTLTDYNTSDHTNLPTAIYKGGRLVKNGLCWGDTDTGAGLNYAIDRIVAKGFPSTTDKAIILVSDGMPHSVDGTSATNALKTKAITAANRAEGLGITIHTITLSGSSGADYAFNESLIRNGGYSLRAADATKLRDLLISVGTILVGRTKLLQ